MSNIRNSRTTHPRKQARRQRAFERFSVRAYIKDGSGSHLAYVGRKEAELAALKKAGCR